MTATALVANIFVQYIFLCLCFAYTLDMTLRNLMQSNGVMVCEMESSKTCLYVYIYINS